MNRLYDISTIAELLSISPWTVRAYAKQGKLWPVHIGRRVLFEQGEVERFLATCRQAEISVSGILEPCEVSRG